jgi:proliferating cell nuclear antigen
MTTVKLETSGDLIRRIDALTSTLVDECKVRLNKNDGLSVTAVDPANVGMFEFEVPPSGFETFDLDYDAVTVGLPRKRLSSIAKYARKGGNSNDDHGDPVTLVWNEETKRFYVHVERDDLDRYSSFAAIDPDSIRQEPDLPGLDLSYEASLSSKTLRDVTRTLGEDDYDHVQVAVEDLSNGVSGDTTAGIRLYGRGDTREDVFRPDATATFVGSGEAEEVASLYSLDYLRDMAKGLHAAKPDSVKVEFGDEFPVRINFSDSTFGLSGTFMLAPRIRSDDDEGPGYESPSFDADLFETDENDADPEEVEA